jgi:hypothetical protein
MRRVTHVFFVPAVLGYYHDFPAGVAVPTLGAARQKSLCKIDQSQKGPQKNSKGTRGYGKGPVPKFKRDQVANGPMERGQYPGH